MTTSVNVSIRPLGEGDLAAADLTFRVAFGTFIGIPDPRTFAGDADYVRTRWRADPSAAFGAYADGAVVGSNFAANWGSVGFLGPLTIRPDLWDQGIGKRLMEPIMACFERWQIRHAGLFTFPHSQKHIGLYRRFGFWPRFLTALVSKPLAARPRGDASRGSKRLSDIPAAERPQAIAACRGVTDAILEGLDVTSDIRSVADQRLGDTLLLWGDDGLRGVAVCHSGAGTEAGSGTCYVKFAGIRPGARAAEDFERLVGACEAFAIDAGAARLTAGVNAARHDAYAALLNQGFSVDRHGVAMQKPNEPGYNRPGVYVLDDWR